MKNFALKQINFLNNLTHLGKAKKGCQCGFNLQAKSSVSGGGKGLIRWVAKGLRWERKDILISGIWVRLVQDRICHVKIKLFLFLWP
jgi:hypothetical protein